MKMSRRYITATISVIILLMMSIVSVEAQRRTSGGRATGESTVRARQTSQPSGQKSVLQRNRVQFTPVSMKHVGDSLVIDMDIDMTALELKTNYTQILTPVLSSGTEEPEEMELPKVLIQGTVARKAYLRELELNDFAYEEFMSNPPYDIVSTNRKMRYHLAVPFESWMNDVQLYVEEDLCGCGDEAKIAHTPVFDGFTKEVKPEPPYKLTAYPVYIVPEVEPIKKRREIGHAYLEYPRGKNEIFPTFGNNPAELAKIDKMIYDISSNSDVTVQGVFMVGYASPESSVKFNTELSRARAESLMRYFMKNSGIPASLFEARTGGEDWEGLLKLIEEYPLPYKSEVLRVINATHDLDEREFKLEKISGGHPWKVMFDDLFPKLRRTDCEVSYTVKDFSLEEARKNLEVAPQLLSLNEMYIVANSHPAGSADFLRVFEIAREEFPEDPVANLNGAAAALASGKVKEAEKYLRLSDPETPQYANNYGIYLTLSGNYSEAEKYLKRAEAAGINEATANLREA